MRKHFQFQRGIGLLEIMLVLSIAAVIIILSARYYQTTRQNQNTANTISIIGDIHKAAMTYAKRKDYDSSTLNLPKLVESGLLSLSQAQNPWGGSVVLSPEGNQAKIVFSGLPNTSCEDLSVRLKKSARSGEDAICSGTTLTVKYDLY